MPTLAGHALSRRYLPTYLKHTEEEEKIESSCEDDEMGGSQGKKKKKKKKTATTSNKHKQHNDPTPEFAIRCKREQKR